MLLTMHGTVRWMRGIGGEVAVAQVRGGTDADVGRHVIARHWRALQGRVGRVRLKAIAYIARRVCIRHGS